MIDRVRVWGSAVLLLAALASPRAALADWCASDVWDSGNVLGGRVLFPNYDRVWVGSFDVPLCLSAWCGAAAEVIQGVTIVNFGTAANSDFKRVYWQASCAGTSTGLLTLTYAGNYVLDGGTPTLPAWTWAGATANFSACPDYCGNPFPCGAAYTLDIYADIASCPTYNPVSPPTVHMGFSTHSTGTWFIEAPISDSGGCPVPWYDVKTQAPDTILYTYKEGPQYAAPGDTVDFTIYYGKPGTQANLTSIEIIDTLPPYTHYIPGSASPAPEAGWDPDAGPPVRLKWSIGTGLATAGGGTGMVTFQASVDWGNGESFEPGSGDAAAPEGARLMNRADAYFWGASCSALPGYTSPPVTTIVRRFLFWMLGDNDLLFAPSLGQPPDEMLYSTFVRNVSASKTWWNVTLWDTVPAELDTWCVNCGFEDPCLGYTMTPSGCANASPGKLPAGGGATLLTWFLGTMPPGYTIEMRWKAQVRPTVAGAATAINKITLRAYGNPRIVNGTGDSTVVKQFTHLAPIVLPITYVSYVSYMGQYMGACNGFYIDFFPLNKKTQFELRGIQYQGAVAGSFSFSGGLSQSIGCLIGDCLGGFPGNPGCTLGQGAISGGGWGGCRIERIPALYDPVQFYGAAACQGAGGMLSPWNYVYKLTSNSPLLWQLMTHQDNCNQDRHTFAPASTLTYAGFMHYTWTTDFTARSSLSMINTGLDVYKNLDPALTTTAHLFKFDYASLQWLYYKTFDIGPESLAVDVDQVMGGYRVMSSDAALLVGVGGNSFSTCQGCCCCGCGDNHTTFAPTRETGYTVARYNYPAGMPYPERTMYGIPEPQSCNTQQANVIVGSVGTANATYEIELYTPNSTVGPATIPTMMRDTGGTWKSAGTFTIAAGLNGANNPTYYDTVPFNRGSTNLFRITLKSGADSAIQVYNGTHPFSVWAGGAVIHASSGDPTGSEFWLHQRYDQQDGKNDCDLGMTFGVDVFAPKQGMVIREVSEDGVNTAFTTTGPDQCVAFLRLTNTANTRNTTFLSPNGNATVLYQQCTSTEKGFTAPFLQMGTHYLIVAPPVVYIGQSFWITVVVLDASNNTLDEYCGITSFTSTDPTARIENTAMNGYDYAWYSNAATGNPCSPGVCRGGTCPGGSCPAGGCDNGIQVFVNVTFTQIGNQTIVATDTLDGSIVGLTSVLVVAADVKLTKQPPLQVAASGDVVQFKICWSNYSSATGSTFTVSDAVPNGTVYYPDTPSNHFCGATKGFGAPTVAYSSTTDTPAAYATMTGPATTAVQYLKWTVPQVGVMTTGCVCFRVTVN